MINALFLLPAQLTAIFDKGASVHAALKSASAHVKVLETIGTKKTIAEADIAYIRPDRVRMRIKFPATSSIAATDRSYTVVGNKLYGHDAYTNEYLVRDVIARGSLSERLNSALGRTEQPVSLLLDAEEMKYFLGKIKTVPGWTFNRNSSQVVGNASINSAGSYQVTFSATNGRVLGAKIVTDKSSLEWTYTYGATPKTIAFTPPKGAVKVEGFRDRQKPPAFADATAKNLYNASVAAYNRRKSFAYKVEDASGTWSVQFSYAQVSQTLGTTSFAWEKGTLTVNQAGKRQTVRCQAKDMEHELSKLRVPVEPNLRWLVQGYNPIERLFLGLKLRSHGSISVGGAVSHVLEGSKAGYRITAHLRGDNRLLAATVSEPLDKKGAPMGRTERRFTYR